MKFNWHLYHLGSGIVDIGLVGKSTLPLSNYTSVLKLADGDDIDQVEYIVTDGYIRHLQFFSKCNTYTVLQGDDAAGEKIEIIAAGCRMSLIFNDYSDELDVGFEFDCLS